MDLTEKSKAYVAAFNAKDLDSVQAFFAEGFSLTDPAVSALSPKAAVCDYIGQLFANAGPEFAFEAINIFTDGDVSIIEFVLTNAGERLRGVDVIHWEGGLMKSMRAYLNPERT
jgi:ketosteroid isomerase-like protein